MGGILWRWVARWCRPAHAVQAGPLRTLGGHHSWTP
jgi:hypothetical protein